MINIEELTTRAENENASIRRREQKVVAKLERRMEMEVAQVRNSYAHRIQQEKTLFEEEATKANEIYLRRAAGEMIADLEQSYRSLQQRSILLEVDSEVLRKAEIAMQMLRRFDNLEDEKAKKVMADTTRDILKMINLDEKYQDVLSCLSGDSFKKETITSYLATRDKIYLLVPVAERTERELAKRLEHKVDALLTQGEISLGRAMEIDITRRAENVHAADIKFFSGIDSVNGFLVYTLKPYVPDYLMKLSRGLAEKMNELQPDGFDTARLQHTVQIIDPQIMEFFMAHKKEDMYSTREIFEHLRRTQTEVSIEKAAEFLGMRIKSVKILAAKHLIEKTESGDIIVDSLIRYSEKSRSARKAALVESAEHQPHRGCKLHFSTTDPSTMKQEAYERLNSYGERLSSKEAIHVLGVTNTGSIVRIAQILGGKIEDRRLYIPKASLYEYISKRKPTGRGWMPIPAQ